MTLLYMLSANHSHHYLKPTALTVAFAFVIASFYPIRELLAAPENIAIGLMADLSGPSSANGEDCRRGFEVARRAFSQHNLVGKHTVRFIYSDHQGDAKTGLTEFNRLVDSEKVWAVATNRSQVGMALNSVSQRKQIPLLGTVGHSEFVAKNPYAWRFFPSARLEGEALATWALKKGKRRAAIISLEDEWMKSLADSFQSSFTTLGGDIVFREDTPQGSDISSLVSRLTLSRPDILVVNFAINESGQVLRRIREQGLTQPILTNVWAAKPEAIASAAGAAEGIVFAEPDLRLPKFISTLREAFHDETATAVTFSCYASLTAALQAIKTLESQATRQDFEMSLRALKRVSLLDADIDIIDREVRYKLEYRTVQNGVIIHIGLPTPIN